MFQTGSWEIVSVLAANHEEEPFQNNAEEKFLLFYEESFW